MALSLRERRGITLVELLVALVISALIVGAAYRAFIRQQKTYATQEQVVDLQQNARISINKMMDEIMMAGFGNVTSYLTSGGVSGFTKVITPTSASEVTIVGGGVTPVLANDGAPVKVTAMSGTAVTLNLATNNILANQLICIGAETFRVASKDNLNLTLDKAPSFDVTGKTVFQVNAVTYRVGTSGAKSYLERNGENIADNIEDIQFEYLDVNGDKITSPVDPDKIRMVKVTLTAKAEISDPDYKGGDGGFRKRTIASNIKVRNLGLNP